MSQIKKIYRFQSTQIEGTDYDINAIYDFKRGKKEYIE